MLMAVGNHFYQPVKGEFVLLTIDENKLTSPVKYEPGSTVSTSEQSSGTLSNQGQGPPHSL